MASLKDRCPDRIIDTTGKLCPYPLIETRKHLDELSTGQVLEVLTDSRRSAEETLPDLSERCGYACEVLVEGLFWRVRIEKSGALQF